MCKSMKTFLLYKNDILLKLNEENSNIDEKNTNSNFVENL